MREWLTFAAAWLSLGSGRGRALALLVALLTTCITTTARASVSATVASNPPRLSVAAAALRHDAASPLRVPHVRANARRLGAPGARSEASTHGPCSAATTPRGRHRLQSLVTGTTTETFAYDALLRTTELLRNGAPVELYLRDDLSDNIAAVSNGTPGLAGMRRRIIWDGVDHPLWMFDADRGVTVYFELDVTGNVRRLHAGERVTGVGAFSGYLGGYSYTAFGRNIPAGEPGGQATPKIDAVDYVQRLQWQGRWLYNRSGGLYDFRARFWSPQLGAFLQLDQYQFLSSGGTLWSWPGQNPFRWRDPSGRDGFSSSELGTPEELADPAYRDGMLKGAGWGLLASPFVAVAMFAAEVEFGVSALIQGLRFASSPAARLAGAGIGAVAGGAKACGDAEAGISSAKGPITKGEQVTEQVIRDAMKGAPMKSQQAGGVSLPRVKEYVDRLLAGEVAPAIKVDGQMIVDGNHRYVAARILGMEPPMQSWAGGRPESAVPWSELPVRPEAW